MARTPERPLWRSLLFVPANVPKFVERAAVAGADALVIDLEDSVPAADKDAARAGLPAVVERLAGRADLLVRINRPLGLAVRDIEAAVCADVCALMIPKVASASHVQLLAEVVDEAESRRGLANGHTLLYGLVEDVAACEHLWAIARAHPRLAALTCGIQDLSASMGAVPDADVMRGPRQQLVMAARAAGILPLGVFGQTADFRDLEALRAAALEARRFGVEGAPCIHPCQVPVLNECFTPTAAEVAAAQRVVDADAEARRGGRGSVALDGRMIDVPVVQRAERVLAMAARIAKRRRTS